MYDYVTRSTKGPPVHTNFKACALPPLDNYSNRLIAATCVHYNVQPGQINLDIRVKWVTFSPAKIQVYNTQAVTNNIIGTVLLESIDLLNQECTWFLEIIWEVGMCVCVYTPRLLKTIHVI